MIEEVEVTNTKLKGVMSTLSDVKKDADDCKAWIAIRGWTQALEDLQLAEVNNPPIKELDFVRETFWDTNNHMIKAFQTKCGCKFKGKTDIFIKKENGN